MKTEGAGGAERDMRFEDGACVYFANHGGAALLDGLQCALQNVAGAEARRLFQCEENVASANGDANFVAGFFMTEGDLDCRCGPVQHDAHDAVIETDIFYDSFQDIFKARGKREALMSRRVQNFTRNSLLNDLAFVDGDD